MHNYAQNSTKEFQPATKKALTGIYFVAQWATDMQEVARYEHDMSTSIKPEGPVVVADKPEKKGWIHQRLKPDVYATVEMIAEQQCRSRASVVAQAIVEFNARWVKRQQSET